MPGSKSNSICTLPPASRQDRRGSFPRAVGRREIPEGCLQPRPWCWGSAEELSGDQQHVLPKGQTAHGSQVPKRRVGKWSPTLPHTCPAFKRKKGCLQLVSLLAGLFIQISKGLYLGLLCWIVGLGGGGSQLLKNSIFDQNSTVRRY